MKGTDIMSHFTLLTDSSCDLPVSVAEKLNIKVVPLSFFIEGQQYSNYLDGRDMKPEVFYEKLSEGKLVTTSATNQNQFELVMESELITGHDILYIGFSSALSATYNCARLAAEELTERFPDRKIYVVDSLCASLGQGLLLYLAAMERKKGKSIDEVREYVEQIKGSIAHWFTVDDLYQLKRGGRISGATAVVGTMLSIKPVLHVDDAGALVSVSKTRGRNAAIQALFKKFCDNAIDPEHQTVFISHGNCLADAKKLGEMIKAKFGCNLVINFVGPVIGAHSGNGTLALFFIATER